MLRDIFGHASDSARGCRCVLRCRRPRRRSRGRRQGAPPDRRRLARQPRRRLRDADRARAATLSRRGVRARALQACLQKSAEIRELLHRYSPIVEGASVDEWYLDLTGTEGVYRHEPLATTAQRIRARIREATGLTLSIGGGTNKLIAKMAVDRAKPSRGGAGVLIVEPGAEDAFLRTCALGD